MEKPTDTLARTSAALAELVRELAWAGEEASFAEVADGLKDRALLDCLEQVGAIANLADAVGARMAGVFAQRSARTVEEPLARRLGARSAAVGVAETARVSVSRAAEWCKVGEALAVRRSLTGDLLPDLHEPVAAALDTGSMCVDAARMIVDTVGTVAAKAVADKVQAWEAFLVNEALENGTQGLGQACRAVMAKVDEDAVELREEELRAKAGVRIVKRADGITRYVIDADPESDGWLKTALDARTAPRRQVRFDDPEDEAAPDAEDRRTTAQKRLDALVSIARESLRHDPGDMSGTSATLLVGISYEALVSGIGAATIYGVDEKISAKTARRIACEAKVLPIVLGGDSQILDLGEGRRLFSEAQRYAMAWRDGGCAWPGCDEPPGRCEAAHLQGWDQGEGRPHGPTDLTNGILFCPFHHRRFDNDGWAIEFRDEAPYLLPPPWIDPTRQPRRAGRAKVPE